MACQAAKRNFTDSLFPCRLYCTQRNCTNRFGKSESGFPAANSNWIVYCKPPFGGPSEVLRYLGRYTHRIAISNNRILGLHKGNVIFRWKDYRDQSKNKIMSLSAQEFIRRFLMHVVPTRFVRIRHFGFLSNRKRVCSLQNIRYFLFKPENCQTSTIDTPISQQHSDVFLCPKCKQGFLITLQLLQPIHLDSS
jgi:hypothetical protein